MPTTSRFAEVNRLTLREQVLESLRAAIVSGQVRPGDHLAETELAESYGVSRGTIREALRSLQQAGLATGDARGKVRVRKLSGREISEIFRVRAALEALAVQEILDRGAGAEAAAELRRKLPPSREVQIDYVDRLDRDLGFHERLCELSGNEMLLATWRGLEDRMRVVMFSPGEGDPVDTMGADHHEPIVALLENEGRATAYPVLFAHMEQAARRWSDGS